MKGEGKSCELPDDGFLLQCGHGPMTVENRSRRNCWQPQEVAACPASGLGFSGAQAPTRRMSGVTSRLPNATSDVRAPRTRGGRSTTRLSKNFGRFTSHTNHNHFAARSQEPLPELQPEFACHRLDQPTPLRTSTQRHDRWHATRLHHCGYPATVTPIRPPAPDAAAQAQSNGPSRAATDRKPRRGTSA